MKKILVFASFVFLTSTLVGCLKDKGYDNEEYGIQIKDVIGVSLPEAPNSPILGSLNAATTPQILSTNISLESASPASSDVTIQLVSSPTLVASAGYEGMPAGSFSLPASVVIKAGTKLATINVTVNNATVLDLTKIYGIGISIASVSPSGITIASNMKSLVLAFSIKNKYDGVYRLKGQFFHPTAAPSYPTFNTELVEMRTTGPNSVKMYCKISGITGFYHPWTATTGGAFTAFASQEPEYTINPTTNVVTVQNSFVGAATFYTMGMGFNNAGYNSRWDNTSKTIFANFGYGMTATTFVPTASRMFIDTLIRLRDR